MKRQASASSVPGDDKHISIEEQNGVVDLDRRFRKLDPKAKAENAALESYTSIFFLRMDSLTWDDLLKDDRVVILGEPGSGKSLEMRERARLLNSQGSFAFFVRLDQLVDQELAELLDADERRRVARWKSSRRPAYFFLDSVDEAKFRRISDFHAVLNKIRNELGSDLLLRAKIYLSSRISEWKPSTDGPEFKRLFPVPPIEQRTGKGASKEIKKPNPELSVVQIEPLDRNRVERFASARGVADVQAFAEAIDRAFAWEFVRRPIDVADLVGFWTAHARIGSLTELIEFDVSTKLRPREARDEFHLSEGEGREGAEWLAAASVSSRRFSFGVPDDGSIGADSLNPRECLPLQWRPEQVRALLNRAIFDSAVYGHLRFHHRRVGEYLAARWVARRMEQGCPQIELEIVLAEVVRGRKVLRPSLRPIAAWLCCGSEPWNSFVRALVLDADPAIHLKYGDPAGLPIEYRRQVLFALSRISRTRKRMWMESSPDCLARLADSALAADIATLIADRGLALDLRIELLDIVNHGRLAACADAAFQVLESPDEPAELRSRAASAIGALGDSTLDARLFQVARHLPQIPNQLCRSIIEALYPRTISPAQLVELLAKTERIRKSRVDLPFYLKSHIKSGVTPENAGDLVRHLNMLAETPPLVRHGQRTLPVSDQFYWLGEVIPAALEILLQKPVLPDEEAAMSAESLQLLGHINEYDHLDQEDVGELNKSTLRHPNVRRNYLWRLASGFRRSHNKEPTMSLELLDHWEVLRLCPEDFSWLVEEIGGRAEPGDRLLALRLAIETWDASGRGLGNRLRLRRAVAGDVCLRAELRRSAVTGPLFPLKKFWWKNVRYKYGKWWWIQKWRTIRERWHGLRGQLVLFRNLPLLASGERLDWLQILSREADEETNSSWAPTTWADLERKRGKSIARAAKRGCVAAWRRFTPQLPHEKPKPNETSFGVIVGLTGLEVEFDETPAALSKLTEDEAKLAARYAMNELNGFPTWFKSLAASHPKAVGDVLCECVEAEWRFPAERKETHEVMARLAWQGESLVQLVQEKLLSLLAEGDSQNRAIMRYAISILSRQIDSLRNCLAQFADQRTSSADDPEAASLWLSVWMQIDDEAAVTRLASALQIAANPDDIVVLLCSALSGEGMEPRLSAENRRYLRPACLRRFIPIVYRHVRIADDIDRSGGGAYSPTARDHAQQYRNSLLNRLEYDEDPTATDALRDLADDLEMAQLREWILNLIDRRLVNEADSDPWTPADIREFAERHEIDPKTDKDLFAIARKRLQVLKWDVEQSDNSARTEMHIDYPEMELRRWLQRRLIERSQNRYTIPQEAEIDQQERPDLRLENPRTNPVSLEVKWADNWTLSVLLERLENQLVGQYLRAHNSRFGIYFLGYIGRKQHWDEPTTGKRLTFEEVVNVVRERAISLTQKNPKIGGLEVVSIDFRQPKRN